MSFVSPHFSLAELIRSEYALRHGLPNAPGLAAIEALHDLASFVLEPIRSLLGSPVQITSGYRSPEVNAGVGGASTSQHVEGRAADLVVQGRGNRDVVLALRDSAIPYDQLILEHGEAGWVHVSYGPRRRHEVLQAYFKPGLGTVYGRFA